MHVYLDWAYSVGRGCCRLLVVHLLPLHASIWHEEINSNLTFSFSGFVAALKERIEA